MGLGVISRPVVTRTPFSDGGLSNGASLKVYEHYNTTGVPLTNTNAEGAVMQTATSTNKPIELRINLSLSNKLKYSSDYTNIQSSFSHEARHINDFKNFGHTVFHNMSKLTRESRAYMDQISQPIFQQTTKAYQYQVKTAANEVAGAYPLTPLTPQLKFDATPLPTNL